MRAMILNNPGKRLVLSEIDIPTPAARQLLVSVEACGICRTDLHVVDGDLTEPNLPLIPGHQIVGRVASALDGGRFKVDDRVGIPWLGSSCGECRFCLDSHENLCDHAQYTGYQINGGFAEYCCADERFCFPIPQPFLSLQAAPLLCAGLIGYRSYRMTRDAATIGLYGFGAAAHIIAQLIKYERREFLSFSRRGDEISRKFAESLGASWSGWSDQLPPRPLDAAIIFAPVGELVPLALRAVRKGGIVVCAGIHMSDIPSFPYADLWGERTIKSVANLTRKDGEEFLAIAPQIPIRTEVHKYSLEQANEALDDLRAGRFNGAAVIEFS